MKRRAAITGIGVISPVGLDHESTFDALLAGRSGVGPITLFDPTEYKTRIAAEVKDFDPTTRLDAKLVRQVDRFCQIGLPAGLAALRLSFQLLDRRRTVRGNASTGHTSGNRRNAESATRTRLLRQANRPRRRGSSPHTSVAKNEDQKAVLSSHRTTFLKADWLRPRRADGLRIAVVAKRASPTLKPSLPGSSLDPTPRGRLERPPRSFRSFRLSRPFERPQCRH